LAGNAAEEAGATVHRGGCYVAIEGPQFSTRAESRMYRAWGADVIGMTAMPEARLAREAELPYALVGMVTDYDCWRDNEGDVEIGQIMKVLAGNVGKARSVLSHLAEGLPLERAPSQIDSELDSAIITAREQRDPMMVARLQAVAGRVLA
ncbi:MAG: S-methyl-5'-thioadenosine phosphorylase, partial [Oxalobacteraceae bacterium]